MEIFASLAAAGVSVTVYGPLALGSYAKEWVVILVAKTSEVELRISKSDADLLSALTAANAQYLAAINHGLPDLSLKQIDHSELPF